MENAALDSRIRETEHAGGDSVAALRGRTESRLDMADLALEEAPAVLPELSEEVTEEEDQRFDGEGEGCGEQVGRASHGIRDRTGAPIVLRRRRIGRELGRPLSHRVAHTPRCRL